MAGATTEIRRCDCRSQFVGSAADYQDTEYGNGMRVHNVVDTAKGKEKRCTVCGKKNS